VLRVACAAMASKVGALFMFLIATGFGALAYLSLDDLWNDETDDAAWSSIVVGGVWVLLAVAFFGLGAWLARDR
jgi:hypothetical protein